MRTVSVTANASGAAKAAKQGDLVIIVDVINMSTTAEAALEEGALAVFGAASKNSKPPIGLIDPEKIGYLAGRKAIEHQTQVVLVTEPRVGSDQERKENAILTLQGLAKAGAQLVDVLPNLGAETVKLGCLKDKVVLLVTDSGGVAFDAAVNNGAPKVLTGTIARTLKQKGNQSAKRIAKNSIAIAKELGCSISVVAASSNALEDLLAAEYIAKTIIEEDFLSIFS